MRRVLLAGLSLALGPALAHSELASSTPAAHAVLSAPPSEVVLRYSEPLEAAFSVFKVYRLDGVTPPSAPTTADDRAHDHGNEGDEADHAHGDETEHDPTEDAHDHAGEAHDHDHDHAPAPPGDPEWLRVHGLAGALVSQVLQGDDTDARVDTGATRSGRVEEVTLPLRDDLAPGVYVVMWRVLSVDTHIVQSYLVFAVAP